MRIKGKISRSSNSGKIGSFEPKYEFKYKQLQDKLEQTLNRLNLNFSFLYITKNYQLKLVNRDCYNYPKYVVNGINRYLKQFVEVEVEEEIIV